MAVITTQDEQHELTLTDTCADGDAIGLNSSGNWVRADANAAVAIRAEWFAIKGAAASGDKIKVAKRIRVFSAAAYTKGALLFLSATPGAHTATNPAATLVLVQCLGRAIDVDNAVLAVDIPHLTIPFSLVSTLPATAANYGIIFTADRPWRLIAAHKVQTVNGSDAGAVTLDIEKLPTGTALDSGVSMLASTFDLKTGVVNDRSVGPTATAADARLNPGDSVALKDTGVLTAVAGLAGSLTFVEDL